MSTTAAAWAVLFVVLLFLSPRRPVWAFSLYLLTFFAAPHLWWWGDDLPQARYAFWVGFVLVGAVLFHNTQTKDDDGHRFTTVHKLALAMIINATLVHAVLAADRTISADTYVELVKYVALFFLIWSAIRNKSDLRIVMMTIALGAAYIGYELTINDRGNFSGSRLEGVGAPSADRANSLACLMLLVLPLIGSLFVHGKKREKLTAVLAAPLVLNVVLLCNSRGAFLGLIASGATFLVIARGATRKKAIRALLLGSVALYLLLGNPKIAERFMSTFVGSEELDGAATSRLEYWQAGFAMLADYPLGAGGSAFKYVLGGRYITMVTGQEEERSLHNGYLTEATDWGVQGLLIKLLFLGAAIAAALRTCTQCRREGRADDALMGMCMIASTVGVLVACMFGSYLGNEWNYWLAAFLVRYSELYKVADTAVGTVASLADTVHVVAHQRQP